MVTTIRFCSFLYLLTVSLNLSANVGIPTIAFIWPFFWLAFIPVIFIEALSMRRAFPQYSFGKLLYFNLASNAASTFLGIPIAYILFYLVSMFAYNTLQLQWQSSADAIWSSMLVFGGFSWEFFVGIAILLTIFFVISVLVERWVFSRMVGQDYNRQLLTKEIIKANVASYIFLIMILVFVAIKAKLFFK